ncbi:DNA polymerase III subunit alpha [candidate division KSB1 bacterium]|nr:DNA polymerase III subunit alpha [candidate division KSB1 bacterium]
MTDFIHLHNHSHYSLLDGACRIPDLVERACKFGMPALALTDHGNMFGAIEFYDTCKQMGIKPLVGAEIYVAPLDRREKIADPHTGANAFHLVLLCKDSVGYRNLMKLVSAGYLEGFYYKPRVDKELLRANSQGIVALSACLKGEVAHRMIKQDYEAAKEAAQEYLDIFGEDFYLEVQNHGLKEEELVRPQMIRLGNELGIKVVATNDIHYLHKEDHEAHDILLCLQTGKDYDDPGRMRYPTQELYFKSPKEMADCFSDFPKVLSNTLEVAEKCDLEIELGVYHLPEFRIPEQSAGASLDDYFEKLCWKGLEQRYPQITPELQERMRTELDVIKRMGFSGYFLIVQDFIQYARSKGIPVGPGRGSAAGSLVAYVLRITNLDPMRYNLLFERFLNIDRVSMPDIDIDFCYERREEVIDYVKEKYGKENVCQIITFGTMAARGVIRDVGRVLKMPYGEVDKIAKLVPQQLKVKLKDAFSKVPELKELEEKSSIHRKLVNYSLVLEGLARHASIHAAGVVITPGELTQFVPLYKTKDGDITTQYDMKYLESVGLLKMDFLGLRTLTVIKDTVEALRLRGIEIDIDSIPLDDPAVYGLFARGETIALFQFESSGMREHLKKLGPECLDDLIAMNALYRPGPMDFIDDFIAYKKGKKEIRYLHPLLEPILKNTYGIAVYQEQVMKIASDLGDYTLVQADELRRAMSKKKKEVMAGERIKFVAGAKKHSIPEKVANEIFDMMDKFSGYGFNKSHAACYSLVAYQTAFLKYYYPAEFMAATISSEMNNTDRVIILLEECRRMGLTVCRPDINKGGAGFVVSDRGIEFGLAAVKNIGKGAVQILVDEREKNGTYKDLIDLCSRIDLRAVNRKVLESLIEAGAMDDFPGSRAQLFVSVEIAIDFGQKTQNQQANGQFSIFGLEDQVTLVAPTLQETPEWDPSTTLNREKNVLGFYLSGHPLDRYREEVKTFSTFDTENIHDAQDGQMVRMCGIITDMKVHYDRKSRPMAFFKLEDFIGHLESLAFADTFEKFKNLIAVESMVMVVGKLNKGENEDPKIVVDEVIALDETRERFTKSLCVALKVADADESLLQEIRQLVNSHSGEIPLYIKLRLSESGFEDYYLRSRTLKVNPSMNLIEQLRDKVGHTNVWVGA